MLIPIPDPHHSPPDPASFPAMSLTSAVANAHAAAAAACSGKKAAQLQLQAEINTDDEWNKFLARDGLLVIDVYTEWCGPCLGMVGNLKKIKVELGGDHLHLAVAKADTIECLKRFRNRSEPTWMFISGGQLVEVIFGADAPRIARTIERELRNEELVRGGHLKREPRAPHELTPSEQEAASAQQKLIEEKKAKEAAAAAAARLARREARATVLETHYCDVCPALVLPHAQKYLRKVADALESFGVTVADKMPLVLGRQAARVLAMEDPALGCEPALAALADRPALALLLKKLPERDGDVIELTRRALFGDGVDPEEMTRRTVAEELRMDAVPGVFAPSDRHQRAAALDVLFPKMVSTACPPPATPSPPHVAMVFGAWQRRAVLAALPGPPHGSRVLRYGFFADANLDQPRLLCKNVEQYEARGEKDFCETIILMVSVGVSEPALIDPAEAVEGPPPELMKLGPLHVSQDWVVGAEECARLFPPGYSEPEVKVKVKGKKKKRKRQEAKEPSHSEGGSESERPAEPDTPETEGGEGGGEGEGAEQEGDGEGEDSEGEREDEEERVDRATSPPPD